MFPEIKSDFGKEGVLMKLIPRAVGEEPEEQKGLDNKSLWEKGRVKINLLLLLLL